MFRKLPTIYEALESFPIVTMLFHYCEHLQKVQVGFA